MSYITFTHTSHNYQNIYIQTAKVKLISLDLMTCFEVQIHGIHFYKSKKNVSPI